MVPLRELKKKLPQEQPIKRLGARVVSDYKQKDRAPCLQDKKSRQREEHQLQKKVLSVEVL